MARTLLSYDIFCDATSIPGSLSSTTKEAKEGKPGIEIICDVHDSRKWVVGLIYTKQFMQ